MAGEDFFKFNKGNEFRFSNFREIKEEDLKGADEKTKKLFNIFAGEDKILQEVEAKSLFNVLKSAAGDNQVLEDNEIKAFAKEHIGEEVDTNILATFVNNIFGTKEKPQTQAMQVAKSYAPQKQQTFLEEAACKEIVIDIIDENLSEAYEILNSQYLGSISGWHDERKDKNDILKTSNVSKVLDYQNAGIEWMNKAKLAPPNGLTKKEYYEGNKQRIKDMILTRVLVLDTNTKFKELKNKYSEEKLAQIIGDYVEQLCSNASMEDLKDIQKQFVSYSGVEEIQALENVVDNAIKFNADKNKPMPYSEVPLSKFDNSKGIVPEYWNTDEPISFEEVYKIERGTEYSQYKIEQYALAKKEMEVVANAYNKKQQFIEFAEGLRKDETLNIDEKTQKVLEGFATFYALAEDGGLSQLQELIAESKLPISIDENGFNFGTLDDNTKNRALNSLLKLAQQSKEKEFEEFLNGKTIEDYQIALAQAHDEAIGDENGKMMAEAMKNDNLTCIQRWTGNTSMAGMGMTIVGGILCFTPLAPLGAGMITVGNTLAIGGMVAKTGLGVTDYATKDVQTAEEAEQLTKDFIMDAGGFIIGMGAGKAGLKAFSKLIDKKLVAVFGQQIASGNKMQALKTVFTNPEYLKNFMAAAGAKLSADFVISYAGDLAMMGILDTQDDWQSLLKANLTGILVGMSGDIKDVSGVGRPRNFGVSDGVRPMTEMDYGQRLLGNDVTVADPKTGATVEGTVTGLYSQNGQVEIEVNGQRYSTNDVAEVKGEANVEVETPKVEISLGQRLETASSREEFVAIRDEIKAMPAGTEKTALQQEYLRKWNEFSRKYNEQFDIRMEYKPETKNVTTDIYNLKLIEGSIDENTEVLVKTKNNIQSLLGESVKNPVYIEKFLNSIPNEYCAKVLEKYIQKHSNNSNFDNMLLGLRKTESILGFVKLLENVNHEINPFKIIHIEDFGFDKYLELQKNGYLPPNRRGFNSEDFKSMDKIQDPEVKHRLHKLYASKMFSGNDFYKLYQIRNEEIDLNKLDRLDSMCDELDFFDEMTMGDCERLLDLSEEQLDIIEKRNLLKKIPDRKNKLSGRDVLELLEVDDKTWDIIQRRNLLADIAERENQYAKSLSAEDIILYSELTDAEWQRIKDLGLLYKEYNNNHNSRSIYATGDKYSSARDNIQIAKMSEAQIKSFEKYQKLVKANDNREPLFDTEQSLKLALLPDAKREFVEKIMTLETTDGKKSFYDNYQISVIANLTDEQIARAQTRRLFDEMEINRYGKNEFIHFSAYDIETLSNLSDETWQRLEKIGLEGTKKFKGYPVLSEFTQEEWTKLPENVQNVEDFSTLSVAIKMNDKAWNRYKADFMRELNYSINETSIKEILSLEDALYNKFQELAQRDDRGKNTIALKLSSQDLLSLSRLNDKSYERIKNDLFHIKGFWGELSVDEMKQIAELNDVRYKFLIDNYISVAAKQEFPTNMELGNAYKFTHYLAGKKCNYNSDELFKLMNSNVDSSMYAIKFLTNEDYKIPFTTQVYEYRSVKDNELVIKFLKALENTQNYDIAEKLLKDNDIKNNSLLVNIMPKLLYFVNDENYSSVKELFLNLAEDKYLTHEGLNSILENFAGFKTGAMNENELSYRISLATELVNDPNFPNELIASSISNTRFDYDAFKEFISPTEYNAEIRKIREFRDAILNDPNLVKDGNYESLEIAQDEVKTRFYNCFGTYKKYFDIAEGMLAKENPTSKYNIMQILQATCEGNDAVSRKLCSEYDKMGLDPAQISKILNTVNSQNKAEVIRLLNNFKNLEIAPEQIPIILDTSNEVSYKQIQALNRTIGKDKAMALEQKDLIVACKFPKLYGVKNINEIPISAKKDLLHNLVSSNTGLFEISDELSKDFPLIPRNQEEYCSLLPSIVRSLGIETNELTPEQRITMFNSSINELSKSLADISDADFSRMIITQSYPKDQFIFDVLDKVKTLPSTERQKVYDYFGFELHHNKNNKTGFSITGYPVNLNNGKKLAQIEDPRTKVVVEALRPSVVRFSEDNKIICNNPKVEQFLNEVIEALPELRTTIGKKQHGNGESYGHDFDILQHSLKVMQKIAQDPKFETMNESDQKIMLLASLMHDITKSEGRVDKTHANYGSFDTFFISQKFNLSKEEEVKLHTIIKQHEWLEYVNSAKTEEDLTKRLQSVAYDLHQGNLFDMVETFTHADLKAVKFDDSFHDTKDGKSRIGFDGSVRSFGESAELYAQRIRGYIKELQKSQPLLPQTKIPRASKINEAITLVNPDGSTNIKGVYKDKDGLVIIKYNEVEDWEAIGFPKGSISRGIEIKKGEKGDAELSEDVNTGNIKFFAHALEYSNQLAKFDAFSLVDSDALLSVSYAERPESKYRFFRSQGVLLDVNSKYIHGGGNHDSGSGYGKNITEFKNNYIFGGYRQKERTYVSDLIKEVTGMTDDQYIEFVETNKDRPIQNIEPVEIRDKIVKAFATINSNTRKGKREYNEMYISNPNEVMGVFAYNINYNENIGNPISFLNRTTIGNFERGAGANGKDICVKERTEFLRQYALERDLPFILFGD